MSWGVWRSLWESLSLRFSSWIIILDHSQPTISFWSPFDRGRKDWCFPFEHKLAIVQFIGPEGSFLSFTFHNLMCVASGWQFSGYGMMMLLMMVNYCMEGSLLLSSSSNDTCTCSWYEDNTKKEGECWCTKCFYVTTSVVLVRLCLLVQTPVIRHSLCALSISHFPSKITDFLCRQCWFAGILLLSLAKEEAIS